MVSKEIPLASKSRILKSRKLATSISVRPGSMNFKADINASSAIAQAFFIKSISVSSLNWRNSKTKLLVAKISNPGVASESLLKKA